MQDEQQLETDPSTWSLKDVTRWLNHEGFSEYSALFEKQRIDGQVLLHLTECDLRDYLQITVLGGILRPDITTLMFPDVKRLHLCIERLRRKNKLPDFEEEEDNSLSLSSSLTLENKKLRLTPVTSFPFTLPSDIVVDASWSSGDTGALPKLLFSVAYLVFVCFVTAFVMTICHDRVPDQLVYHPFPCCDHG